MDELTSILAEQSVLCHIQITANHISYVNSAFAKLTGYSCEELKLMSSADLQDLVHPSYRNLHPWCISDEFVSTEPNHQEFVLIRKDGCLVDVESFSKTIFDDGVKSVVTILFDISERHRFEQAKDAMLDITKEATETISIASLLKKIHTHLYKLIDASNFYVALYDEKTALYYFPYAIDDQDDDFSPQPLKGSLTDYVRRTGKPMLIDDEKHRELAESGEVGYVGPDSPLWMGAPLVTRTGIIGVVAAQWYQVPTKGHKADLDLLSYVSKHIAWAIERKRADAFLRESERKYRTVSERALLYLDLMGHDIRNQLQVAVGATELLKLKHHETDFISTLDMILLALENCLSVISQIKATEYLMDLELTQTEIGKILRESVDYMLQNYPQVEIDLKIPSDEFYIWADRFLGLLFRNIMENAVVHNNSNQIRLWVSLKQEHDGYSITIEDNGPGIPKKRTSLLFDKKRRYGGVGLHQSKHIVDKYNGTIDIINCTEDIPKRGTRVKIWFPMMSHSDSMTDI
ncbi:MAG: PAS domain S-box protein [Candidatus Lokiarchaeota archaeon]|nr:PAS domain S-box protein [Candidatus Lokiarchaeota archaeon]